MLLKNKMLHFFYGISIILLFSSCSLKYHRETISEENVPQISFEQAKLIQYSDNKKIVQLDCQLYEQYKNSGEIYIKNSDFLLYNSDEKVTSNATANLISVNNKVYEFFDGLDFFDNEQNTKIVAQTVKWNENTEQLVSAKNQDVTIKKDNLEITGKDFSASIISNTFLFSGQVHGQQLLTKASTDDHEKIIFSGDSMQGSVSSSDDSPKKNYTMLSGNAYVKTDTMEIYADSIELSGKDFNEIKAFGNIKGTNSESELSFSADQLEYSTDTKIVMLSGNVELNDIQNDVVAKAQNIEYDQNSDVAIMQIDVELKQKKNICRGAYSIYRKNEQTLELAGNASVIQDEDTFRAQSIKFNMETEEIVLDGNIRGTVNSSTK